AAPAMGSPPSCCSLVGRRRRRTDLRAPLTRPRFSGGLQSLVQRLETARRPKRYDRCSERRSSGVVPSCGAPPGPLMTTSPSWTSSRGSARRYASDWTPPRGSPSTSSAWTSPCCFEARRRSPRFSHLPSFMLGVSPRPRGTKPLVPLFLDDFLDRAGVVDVPSPTPDRSGRPDG